MDIHIWEEIGYQPLVFTPGWQVALLNWEPIFDSKNMGEIERHNLTDEVFVLLKGKALLFTDAGTGLSLNEMQVGKVYNVRSGTWHNLVSSRDASWVIVEDRDTHLNDTEIRRMDKGELEQVKNGLPEWVNRE